MQGCKGAARWLRTVGFVCPLLVLAGCARTPAQPQEPPAVAAQAPASEFNPATAGSISGVVLWRGDAPASPPFVSRNHFENGRLVHQQRVHANPNLPIVDRHTKAVRDAVVFLRGVDARRARPWNHAPVRVEQQDLTLHVRQGSETVHVGFVRRGDEVTMVSREPAFHALQARGAAFFSLPFPDPDRPLTRRLTHKGVVELSSAAGYFWMRGYLFVDEHPYYTRTDEAGRFVLDRVPPGRYQVVCWLPSWQAADEDRDPESGLVVRLRFRPPVERVREVTVGAGEKQTIDLQVSVETFEH